MEIKERLEEELRRTMERLRQLGGAVMIEEFPGASADTFSPADPMDEIQMSEAREIGFATLSRLVRRWRRHSIGCARGSTGSALNAGRRSLRLVSGPCRR